MKRIDTADRYMNKFAAGKHGFADEDALTGLGGTFMDSTWHDHIQEEIASVIEGAAITLNPAVYNQLNQALVARDAAVALAARRESDLICASNWRREGSGLQPGDVNALTHNGVRRWVAVGEGGLIATSDDQGETWTARTAASSFANNFNGAHYAAGLYVIVGESAEVQTSSDGVTWTRRNSVSGPELYGVTYDGTGWVAVGSSSGSGYVITAAAAAVTWTVRTAPTSTTQLDACASDGAGRVVAVGNRASSTLGQVSVSTNQGVTWTSEPAPSLVGTLRAVAYGQDSVFYAGGEGGDIISSAAPTGAASSSDWTTVRSASDGSPIHGIAAPGDAGVVAARGGITSNPADPLIGHVSTWRVAQTPTTAGALCAHYGAGMIMIGLDNGGVLRSLVFGHRLAAV